MSSLPTPPRLGLRVPLPRAPREAGGNDDELRPGDLLEGRYQIEDRLGEGGVGYVYRARQIKLHRRVAIKLLQQDVMGDEELKPRFEREALTLAALSHPHIVSLTDYGTVRGRPYLVMELLEGFTLREIIDREGPVEPRRALTLARQILLALAYAHELGIVHRDLKPANLLLQAMPCHEHIKVLDFGLVKFTPGSYLDSGVQLSRIGFTFGTPAYMSPEHAVGGEVDGRSDLYAMGVLIFELVTGTKPFDGELQDVLRAHFQAPVPKIWERRQQLAGLLDLQTFIERAMAKEPVDRFADAARMIAAVDVLLAPKSSRAGERTETVALMVRHSRIDSLRVEAARVSGVAAEKTREALLRLRSKAGPLLVRVARKLRRGATHSYVVTLDASKRSYRWLKPRAVEATRKLGEGARAARTQIEARVRRTPSGGMVALPAPEALTQASEAEAVEPAPVASNNTMLVTAAEVSEALQPADPPAEELDAAAQTVLDAPKYSEAPAPSAAAQAALPSANDQRSTASDDAPGESATDRAKCADGV